MESLDIEIASVPAPARSERRWGPARTLLAIGACALAVVFISSPGPGALLARPGVVRMAGGWAR